jgi:hypothetical protein
MHCMNISDRTSGGRRVIGVTRASRFCINLLMTTCRCVILSSSWEIAADIGSNIKRFWDGEVAWCPPRRSGTGVIGSSMSFAQLCPQLAQKIEDMVLVETFINIFLFLSKETQLGHS